MSENKLAYIASPYAGDIEKNVAFAKAACRYAMEQNCTPVAVHLLYPQFLDDNDPAQRESGLRMGHRVLEACDELRKQLERHIGNVGLHGRGQRIDAVALLRLRAYASL